MACQCDMQSPEIDIMSLKTRLLATRESSQAGERFKDRSGSFLLSSQKLSLTLPTATWQYSLPPSSHSQAKAESSCSACGSSPTSYFSLGLCHCRCIMFSDEED